MNNNIKNIIDALFDVNITMLLIQDMLSNYCAEHGDEKLMDSEFVNKLDAVGEELINASRNAHQSIKNSNDFDF